MKPLTDNEKELMHLVLVGARSLQGTAQLDFILDVIRKYTIPLSTLSDIEKEILKLKVVKEEHNYDLRYEIQSIFKRIREGK